VLLTKSILLIDAESLTANPPAPTVSPVKLPPAPKTVPPEVTFPLKF